MDESLFWVCRFGFTHSFVTQLHSHPITEQGQFASRIDWLVIGL
jgi:hypothetical protein